MKNRAEIETARWPQDIVVVARLLREYKVGVEASGYEFGFDDFEHEIDHLSDTFLSPLGAFLIARMNGEPAGCIGIKPISAETAELKRLFVDNGYRGQSIGRELMSAALGFARNAGYRRIRLDSLPSMKAAHRLYDDFNFCSVSPYHDNPDPTVEFFELDLTKIDGQPNDDECG